MFKYKHAYSGATYVVLTQSRQFGTLQSFLYCGAWRRTYSNILSTTVYVVLKLSSALVLLYMHIADVCPSR